MDSVIFSAHALSATEKEKVLLTGYNNTEYISLFELKQIGSVLQILKKINSFKRREVFVFMNFENSALLKGFLYSLPILCFRLKYFTIEKEGFKERSILDSLIQYPLMVLTIFLNFLFFILFYLLKFCLPVILWARGTTKFDFKKFESCLYIKSNFWFGIQAGGSVGHISGVCNRLSDFFSVTYLAPDEPILLESNIRIKQLQSDYRFSIPNELNNLGFNFVFIKSFKEFFSSDFYYQRLSLYNFSGAFFSLFLNKPLIIEYNGSEVWIHKNWSSGLRFPRLASAIEELNLKTANRIITVSEVLKTDLINRGISPEKIFFYPNCIDPLKYSPDTVSHTKNKDLRTSLGIGEKTFIFTFVGTFGPWHGVEFLIDGINNLFKKTRGLDVKFLLVGDGVLRGRCEELLDNSIKSHVIFTGLIQQEITPQFLAISDCFLSPHVKREGEVFFGSPTKIFEYMAMGKPIIASNLEQIGNIFKSPVFLDSKVSKESDCLLFEPNNVDDFVSLMQFVYSCEPKDRTTLGMNARQLAIDNYTWKKHVEVLLS